MKNNPDNRINNFVSSLDGASMDVRRGTDDLFDMVSDDRFSIRIARREVKSTQGISIHMRRNITFTTKR